MGSFEMGMGQVNFVSWIDRRTILLREVLML